MVKTSFKKIELPRPQAHNFDFMVGGCDKMQILDFRSVHLELGSLGVEKTLL